MKYTNKSFVIYSLSCVAFAAAENMIRLEPSANPPSDISSPVDHSFAGFGIESSNLFSFTGGAQPNTLTINLLNNLANYAGKPPHIRIGGNTQDYMIFQESQAEWSWINNPNAVGQGSIKADSMLIGPRFFEAANRLPKGTTVTWGLNLAYEQSDFIEKITTMAEQALTKCPNLNITSFEIGNEPDLYTQNGFRAGPWGGAVFTQEWLARASAISAQVLAPKGIARNFFEAAATASTIGTDFQIANLVTFGVSAGAPAPPSYLSGWNQHDYYYYIGVSGYAVSLERLLTLRTTEDQFAAWAAQVDQAAQTPYPYALREMGVVGPIGLQGVTDVFGAALWTLNFLLYAAGLGVASVGLHMTDNSNASAWLPIPMYGREPHVRPLYYGVAAFDQVVGPAACARTQIAQYTGAQVPAEYQDWVRAYSVYQQEKLASVVVVNGKMANSSLEYKGNVTVQLQLPASAAGQVVYLAYLTGPGADATADTTWNGISFEKSGDGTPTQVDGSQQTVLVAADGTASFFLRDTEAVVASLGRKLGAADYCAMRTRDEVP
ncbi:glycoside hydrolase family 79 protein [Annulohypoxylon truncatum]|uniref:glycoside hydrolase family 79 protein n=1 Tax=Annulohypoxylon truncatum TaxID=327061 RepID=UPI0020088BBE|nr:glycoside hydrolase family 79 protein [Annulohypoxylon truncatum]KAI1214480.1 glycoside hydrolase family 79 protein [Annulohypoxylon truncatum]